MKKRTVLVPVAAVAASFCLAAPTYADTPINSFTDPVLKSCVVDAIGKAEDAITAADLQGLTNLECNSTSDTIADAAGLEQLTGLRGLLLGSNSFTSIDLSQNTSLVTLSIHGPSHFSQIDLSHNTALTEVVLPYNSLTSLDLSQNTALETLLISGDTLTSLDLSNNTELNDVHLDHSTALANLDISNSTKLTALDAEQTALSSIDLSNNTALQYLWLDGTNIISLDLSKNTALMHLYAPNKVLELDVTNNTALAFLGTQNPNLVVTSNVVPVEGAETEQYDLMGLDFVVNPYVIGDSDDYTFDPVTGIMAITKEAGTEVLAPVVDVNNNNAVVYRLLIRKATDPTEDKKKDDDSVVNPNTLDDIQGYIQAVAILTMPLATIAAFGCVKLVKQSKDEE